MSKREQKARSRTLHLLISSVLHLGLGVKFVDLANEITTSQDFYTKVINIKSTERKGRVGSGLSNEPLADLQRWLILIVDKANVILGAKISSAVHLSRESSSGSQNEDLWRLYRGE